MQLIFTYIRKKKKLNKAEVSIIINYYLSSIIRMFQQR